MKDQNLLDSERGDAVGAVVQREPWALLVHGIAWRIGGVRSGHHRSQLKAMQTNLELASGGCRREACPRSMRRRE
jgi:hypothetical protein